MTPMDTSWKSRLRMPRPVVPLNVVLVNPEIPQNTGNIGRLCAATGSRLHLVGKLGFSLDEKAVRRAGLDYWHLVDVQTHDTFSQCLLEIDEVAGSTNSTAPKKSSDPLLFTTGAEKSFVDAPYKPGGILVFGAESVGLPKDIIEKYGNSRYGIPTISKTVRSLNLGNSVGIVIYKALEIVGALDQYELMP